jgi:Integrase core domain
MTPANLASTYVRKAVLRASFVGFGRRADRSACHWAVVARYSSPPLRVAALRRSSREIVEADRPSRRPISCMERPWTRRSAISSRSSSDRYRPERGLAEDLNIAGGMPPAFRNHLVPTGCDTPASTAASSLLIPAAIADQNRRPSSRPATGGRPGDGSGARPDRSDRRFRMLITTSSFRVLRRPLEFAQYAAEAYAQQLALMGAKPSMSRTGCCYDNAPMESFFHSLKVELVHQHRWTTREEARRDLFVYIESYYNRQRIHSAIGYLTPEQAERKMN